MMSHGYKRINTYHYVFAIRFGDNNFIILLLYINDMLLADKNVGKIYNLKKDLNKFFDEKDLGPAKKILGIEIKHGREARKLWLSQIKYIEWVPDMFKMKITKLVGIPLVGHFKLV